MDDYVILRCPEPGCDYEADGDMVDLDGQYGMRQDFITHWLDDHAPTPPEPIIQAYDEHA